MVELLMNLTEVKLMIKKLPLLEEIVHEGKCTSQNTGREVCLKGVEGFVVVAHEESENALQANRLLMKNHEMRCRPTQHFLKIHKLSHMRNLHLRASSLCCIYGRPIRNAKRPCNFENHFKAISL